MISEYNLNIPEQCHNYHTNMCTASAYIHACSFLRHYKTGSDLERRCFSSVAEELREKYWECNKTIFNCDCRKGNPCLPVNNF